MTWPFKWKLSACTFTWCYYFVFQTFTKWNLEIWSKFAFGWIGSERVKHQHKTTWNGNKWHNDGLNTDRDMAYSSKREATTLKSGLSYPPTSLRGPLPLVWHCPMNDWEFLAALLLPTILHRTSHSVDHLQPTFAWSVIINSNHLQKYFWAKSTFFLTFHF